MPDVLKSLGFINPTEIQKKAIPLALQGLNVIGQSKTGTGKTLAYTTPIIDKINPSSRNVEALVITPTRELCVQVANTFRSITKHFKIGVLEVYGGVDISHQKTALKSGKNQIVVATPGRLIDIYKQRFIDLSKIKTVVLDEADRMLDMGFFPDVEYIFRKLPKDNLHVMLFSATIFEEIMKAINKVTAGQYVIVRVGKNEDEFVVKEIRQEKYIIIDRNKKYATFKKILKKEKPEHMLVFCNTISKVELLYRRLKNDMKVPLLALTGKINQKRREKILNDFKTKKIQHLIATDVASRGLDIPNITHIINYDVPRFPENYVHRIGRTGRLDRKGGRVARGKAITLCLQSELIYMQRIEELIMMEIPTRELESDFKPRNPFIY